MLLAQKNRYIDQWNTTENREMDPQLCGLLIFGKERLSNGQNAVSSTNYVGKTGQQRMS